MRLLPVILRWFSFGALGRWNLSPRPGLQIWWWRKRRAVSEAKKVQWQRGPDDTVDGRNPAPPEIGKTTANSGRFSISTGAGFLPSTGCIFLCRGYLFEASFGTLIGWVDLIQYEPRWWQLKYFWIVHPGSLGKWSNLTSIFFKWVETTTYIGTYYTSSPKALRVWRICFHIIKDDVGCNKINVKGWPSAQRSHDLMEILAATSSLGKPLSSKKERRSQERQR